MGPHAPRLADDRAEPDLTPSAGRPSNRLRAIGLSAGARAAAPDAAPRLELRAGERACIPSADSSENGGQARGLLVKAGLIAVGILALVGSATLVHRLLGL